MKIYLFVFWCVKVIIVKKFVWDLGQFFSCCFVGCVIEKREREGSEIFNYIFYLKFIDDILNKYWEGSE